MKKFLAAILIAVAAVAGLALYLRREWRIPTQPPGRQVMEIPHGAGAMEVVNLLHGNHVVENKYAALAYVFLSGSRHRLKAGEYMFDRPLTIPQVIQKLYSGAVYLHKFTVPEGMTTSAIAQKWEEQGFGAADDFMNSANASIDLVRSFDGKAESIEGYLFPETYSFPKGVSARQAIQAMIGRFQQTLAKLEQILPTEKWPLGVHETVILASLVEAETDQPGERPLVASVYLNRLNRRIPLQCDPTVIYALEQASLYRGQLTHADLQFKSPFNTYTNPGLPPSAIANPGFPSLMAAIQPATTKYLFFVRSAAPGHTFSETLAAHNRAVTAYRRTRTR